MTKSEKRYKQPVQWNKWEASSKKNAITITKYPQKEIQTNYILLVTVSRDIILNYNELQ